MTGTGPTGNEPVRVFISYAHSSSEHVRAVRDLWRFLCSRGIDARLDTSAEDSRQDWALWTLEQVRDADYVLVVASAAYRRRAEGLAAPEESRGVPYEAGLIREDVYADPATARSKYLPVLLADGRIEDIPAFLGPRSTTHYRVADLTAAHTEPLLRVLTGRGRSMEPGLGAVPAARRNGDNDSGVPDRIWSARLSAGDLGRLTNSLLQVREVSSPAQWQQVIDLLPSYLAEVIPRQHTGRAEAIALLRTCEHYPRSWTALVEALRLVGPHSPAVQRFAEDVERLGLEATA
jgi:hypothetical protein